MENKKFRIHLLGLPHTKTTIDFTACAYTMKVWKFCKMMEGRGHHLMHYGHEESNPAADENISVISSKEWDAVGSMIIRVSYLLMIWRILFILHSIKMQLLK